MPQGLVIYWNSIKMECQLEMVAFIYSETTTEEHLDQTVKSLILLIVVRTHIYIRRPERFYVYDSRENKAVVVLLC